MKEILNTAIQAAVEAGAEYVEARWCATRNQHISARGRILTVMQDDEQAGVSVRAFFDGAWGFACSPKVNAETAARLGHQATDLARASFRLTSERLELLPIPAYQSVWKTPVKQVPFDIPLNEKADVLFTINEKLLAPDRIREANAHLRFLRHHKLYLNSIGSDIEQFQYLSEIRFTATAVGDGRFATRTFQGFPRGMGYELISEIQPWDVAPQISQECLEKLAAKKFSREKTDLILMPSHTCLVIHETIGHATELDRILGWEADYAGTSFATPEKLGNYRYASPVITVTADRIQKHGLASCGFDDEGAPTRKWHIIRDGILNGYATTRDTAPFIGQTETMACASSDRWSSVPILRMANVGIDPGPEHAPDLNALIADTEEGVLVDGMGSFSIDQQRINFQFGGDFCRRIHHGRLTEVLRDFVYGGSNPGFWSSADVVCRPDEWRPYGIWGCAKGQPVQITALTHGSAPIRIRNVSVHRGER